MNTSQGDAAYLRLVFEEAASDFDGWFKNSRKVWERLYERVRDTTAGIELYALVKEQEFRHRKEIERLTAEIDRLNTELAKYKQPLPLG